MKFAKHSNIGLAKSATLHCIAGCSIGEIIGMSTGTIVRFSNLQTIALSIVLAFLFGFGLSTLPLLKSGLNFTQSLRLVAAADTLSIATMEVVDNIVMLVVPGAMNAGLVNPIYWTTMPLSLVLAFFAAYPVNLYLLNRGKGHALVHENMKGHTH
jgi:hypothetical protein